MNPRFPGFLDGVSQFLFPRACAACAEDVAPGEPGALCGGCRAAVPRRPGLACETCDVPLPDGGAHCYVCRAGRRKFRFCRSAGLYEGVLKACLIRLKYEGKDYLADTLGGILAETAAERPELGEADGVVCVPLHFWRRWRRGYNQAELLAESYCRRAGRRWLPDVLTRCRATPSQTDLRKEERFQNVEGAFAVRKPALVKGRRLLLVDDVCTTGATLEACAAALKAAGARSVDALTVARQV
ncbi:MAG: ComF family protein [Elusimicrobiota bacterium]